MERLTVKIRDIADDRKDEGFFFLLLKWSSGPFDSNAPISGHKKSLTAGSVLSLVRLPEESKTTKFSGTEP